MDLDTITVLLSIAIEMGTPLLLASLGEIYAERAGVLNLGVEGIMSVGAVTGFVIAYTTNSALLAIIGAAVVGAMLAAIHGFVTVYLRGNQIISGLAITMMGLGISSLIGLPFIGEKIPILLYEIPIPLLADIPIIGAFFNQDAIVYLSYALTVILWFILFKTRIGYELRAVGESPIVADTAGINVNLVRFLATIFGGALAGIGGSYYSLVIMKMWIENLTLGKGWIALALVILALWNPLKALAGAYLFGFIDALTIHLQIYGFNVYILGIFPYAITIIVLTLSVIRLKGREFIGPSALGKPYIREEEALHG